MSMCCYFEHKFKMQTWSPIANSYYHHKTYIGPIDSNFNTLKKKLLSTYNFIKRYKKNSVASILPFIISN